MLRGNTVGSLSEVQKQLILGCILGDGYMRKKVNAHLQITHSIKQKEYVLWKYSMLKNIVITAPHEYRGNAGRVGYRFFTKSLPDITDFYNKFYQNGKKIIPKDLTLSPLSLAVLYMDDGSKSRKTCYFNCQQFDTISQNNLVKSLSKLNIEARFHKDKTYKRIYIPFASIPLLIHTIKQYIVPTMRYKIPI
ncbi:hypothetical protein A2141_02855 [Candidatus Woesebacteria bacterium RBG_16_40_11]|nr:MAG: hypothetical protein A2141_02855 [Candidatus Woesebacteria bacterium RBG_16_40_11]